MANIVRVRTVTVGLPGGPYLSTHYFRDVASTTPNDLITLVHDFWTDLRLVIATPATMQVQPILQVIDEATGDAIDERVGTEQQVTGAGGSTPNWTAKQGVMTLRTGKFINGRPVIGKVYVPGPTDGNGVQTPNSAYNGTLAVALSELQTNSSGPGPWVVWSRKNGIAHPVRGGGASPQWGVLRSRRT